jgi:hypothetical protein
MAAWIIARVILGVAALFYYQINEANKAEANLKKELDKSDAMIKALQPLIQVLSAERLCAQLPSINGNGPARQDSLIFVGDEPLKSLAIPSRRWPRWPRARGNTLLCDI